MAAPNRGKYVTDFFPIYLSDSHTSWEPWISGWIGVACLWLFRCADPNVRLSTQRGPSQMTSLAVGHPKLAKLEEIVLEHFVHFHDGTKNPSLLYRDSSITTSLT